MVILVSLHYDSSIAVFCNNYLHNIGFIKKETDSGLIPTTGTILKLRLRLRLRKVYRPTTILKQSAANCKQRTNSFA